MQCKVDIFSGFLGAGKTMLIKKLIQEKLSDEKLVIIENEFGEIGIDGAILKKANIDVKEINAGCICCTISGDFKKAIIEVLNTYRPDRIMIEPSGVGKLSEVVKACRELENQKQLRMNMLITVIDVLKFDIYKANFGEFYEDQIRHAQTIVLSRTQKTSWDKIEKVASTIRTMNSKASVITTPWELLKGEKILDAAEHDVRSSLEEQVNLIRKPTGVGSIRLKEKELHRADHVFETWGVETPKYFSKEQLKNIFHEIKQVSRYGVVLRAKGIVQAGQAEWVQFDFVPDEFEIQSILPDYTGRLCVIGSGLKRDNLKILFNV